MARRNGRHGPKDLAYQSMVLRNCVQARCSPRCWTARVKCRVMNATRSTRLGAGGGSVPSSPARIERKTHGSASAPRPTTSPAQPVSFSIRLALGASHTSPLPKTGRPGTASTTDRMPAKSTAPVNAPARVRPWMVSAATPASARMGASRGAWSSAASQPRRVFTVTGIVTARVTVATNVPVRSGSFSMAAPAPSLTTFSTGQPMLMSTASAPHSCSRTAASRTSSATGPNNWTLSGRSSARVSINSNARRLPSSSERACTSSVVAQPNPPTSRMHQRNGRVV